MRRAYGLLLVVVLTAACATMSQEKSFSVAVSGVRAQKELVESATVEAIKLHNTGKLSDADLTRVQGAYVQWAQAESLFAEALAQWRTVMSADNANRLQAALDGAKAIGEELLTLLAQYVDLSGIKARLGQLGT